MSTSSKKRVANAVGGKTARACDSCIKKRARWYCAADDAFLCQACDSYVHSANPLARRHQRVRLRIAAFLKSLDLVSSKLPSWHQGFTRKARTPRHLKTSKTNGDYSSSSFSLGNHVSSLVPEVGLDDQVLSTEENDEDRDHQLLYRVPIFDPSLAQFCDNGKPVTTTRVASSTRVVDNSSSDRGTNGKGGLRGVVEDDQEEQEGLKGFLESDMDLVNFSADVESLLGRGLEDESSFGMEELGLLVGCKEKKEVVHGNSNHENKVKLEEEEEKERVNMECEVDLERGGGDAPFEFSFDYGDNDESLEACGVNDEEEEEDQKVMGIGVERDFKYYMINNGLDAAAANDNDNNKKKKNKNKNKKRKREISLKLDYEAVISAWSSQGGSPWTNGCRPDFDPDQCWPDFLGTCGTELQQPYIDHASGIAGGGLHQAITGDGGREARVSRYREKRRTRLFSKKIRYEVRKLNAEKRPRMKGRFVKRAPFSAPAFPLLSK